MAGWDVEIGKKCEKCVYWLPPVPFEKNLRTLFCLFPETILWQDEMLKLMKNVFCNCLRCHLWTILEFIAGSKHLNKKVSAMQYFILNIWAKYKYKYKPLTIQPPQPTLRENILKKISSSMWKGAENDGGSLLPKYKKTPLRWFSHFSAWGQQISMHL